jgi:hypothetical protein
MKMWVLKLLSVVFAPLLLSTQGTGPAASRGPEILWEFDTGG